MENNRPAAVNGIFYPATAAALRTQVTRLLAEADALPTQPQPVALIVPHAGYIYSGAVAASAFTRLKGRADAIQRLVIIGPAHRQWVQGLAVPTVENFETPLGDVPLDRQQIDRLLQLPFVAANDCAHAEEHCIEVQLPFLQTLLRRFSLIPLLAGDTSAEQIRQVIDLCMQSPGTLVVISSDLSHFLDYQAATALDRLTARSIEMLDPAIDREQACGRLPILGMMAYAREHGWSIRLVDLRNSGDTAGTRDQVVGYGAFVVCR